MKARRRPPFAKSKVVLSDMVTHTFKICIESHSDSHTYILVYIELNVIKYIFLDPLQNGTVLHNLNKYGRQVSFSLIHHRLVYSLYYQ